MLNVYQCYRSQIAGETHNRVIAVQVNS